MVIFVIIRIMPKRGDFMRMRKKKHLSERMDKCIEFLIKTDIINADSRAEISTELLDFSKIFGNGNEVELEIGCGKGGFICEMAKQNPGKNFLAVERVDNVLISALESAKEQKLKNVRFMDIPAEYLLRYIKPNSLSRIYLNFSCPYPKKTYANRRLTNPKFLDIYSRLLINGAEIHQKTDNQAFFEYSLEMYSKCGYTIKNISLNLHKSDFKGNILTEYESKFSQLGLPIYRVEAFKN